VGVQEGERHRLQPAGDLVALRLIDAKLVALVTTRSDPGAACARC
jgi:hypothetical protein